MTNAITREQSGKGTAAGLGTVAAMILVAAALRLIPHPPNFTPVGAMALFGGAALADRRLAFLFPLLAMLLSDVVIGFDGSRPFVYGAMLLIVLLGRTLQHHRRQPLRVAAGALASSLLFFSVTNFGVWWMSGWYTHTAGELIRCYTLAIPFFGNTVIGDLVFSGSLFGGLAMLESRASVAATLPVES